MSIEAMVWAIQLPLTRLKNPTHRRILLSLANYAGKKGETACPSKKSIHNETGYDQSTIKRALRALEKAKIIRRESQHLLPATIPKHRKTNVYTLAMDAP